MNVLGRVRRPEYTGRNRCWPCTITNAVLLVALSAVAGVVWLPLTAAVLVAGAAGIWLRGYLVPYTPQVAPALFDRLPIPSPKSREPVGRGSIAGTGDEAVPDGEAVLEALLDAGVVDADEESLAVDPSFRDAWSDEQRALQNADGEALAAAIESTTPVGVTARAQGSDGSLVLVEGAGGGVTLARPIAIAEAAAARALEATAPELSAEVRAGAVRPLRGFLESCPVCDADVVETTPRSCCGTTNPRDEDDRILACPSCDRRLYTFPS
ncbi:hypothetical protein [Natronoarchaeum rubrum]|uniref:hypothetical protein n=1 Tax=Natronoarchaeum rubrum TaxID=755311 RepID=UPI002111C414|nr:hypothetical protein [Natronoarchaeum rubrum]